MQFALIADFWQVILTFEKPNFHVITSRYHRVSQTNDHLNVSQFDIAPE